MSDYDHEGGSDEGVYVCERCGDVDSLSRPQYVGDLGPLCPDCYDKVKP